MRSFIFYTCIHLALSAQCSDVRFDDHDALLQHCDSVRDGKLSVRELSNCITAALWGDYVPNCVTPHPTTLNLAELGKICPIYKDGECGESDYERVPSPEELVRAYDADANGFINAAELSSMSPRILLAALTTRKGSAHGVHYELLREVLGAATDDPTIPMSIRLESVMRLWQRYKVIPVSAGGGVVVAAVAVDEGGAVDDGHGHRRATGAATVDVAGSRFPSGGSRRRKVLSSFLRMMMGARPTLVRTDDRVGGGGALRQAGGGGSGGGGCLTAPAAFAAADQNGDGAISALELPLLQIELLRCLLPTTAAGIAEEEEECDPPGAGGALLATFVSTLIVSLIALVGLCAIPVGKWMTTVLRPLVCFAVGALLGDVFIHIIPHSFPIDMGDDGHSHSEPITEGLMVGRFAVILASFWFFFLVDRTIRTLVGSSHAETAFHDNEDADKKKKKGGGKDKKGKSDKDAGTQESLYNYNTITEAEMGEGTRLGSAFAMGGAGAAQAAWDKSMNSGWSSPVSDTPGAPGKSKSDSRKKRGRRHGRDKASAATSGGVGGDTVTPGGTGGKKEKRGHGLSNAFFGQAYDVRGDGKTPSFFKGEVAPVAYVNLVSDGVHNFVDGVTIGVAFSTDAGLGLSTTLAIVFHELAQEFGDFAILLSAGMAKWQALLWNFVSGVIAILGGLLGVVLGQSGDTIRIWILLIAAGAFLYIAATSMLSELLAPPKGARKATWKNLCLWRYWRDVVLDTLGFAAGVAIMWILLLIESEDC